MKLGSVVAFGVAAAAGAAAAALMAGVDVERLLGGAESEQKREKRWAGALQFGAHTPVPRPTAPAG